MIGLALALAAAYGTFLVFTAVAFGWSGMGMGPPVAQQVSRRPSPRDRLARAGLGEVRPVELVGACVVLLLGGAALAWVVFGGVVVPLAVGLAMAGLPVMSARRRRQQRVDAAREAWPRMIEEIRLEAGNLGRSLPQALLVVGARGPAEMRPAFAAAEREWFLSTDFARTIKVLKTHLADATADTVCETLLVAHQVGGADVDRRLHALVEDRIADLAGRKDARAKQAGARFARRFVIGVPIGMALAGLSIGDGRAAFATPLGQAAVLVAIGLMAACWWWAGRILRLPDEQRVFG